MTKEQVAIALIERAIETWAPDIDGDEPINGSDAVYWLCGFIKAARAAFAEAEAQP